MTTTQPFGGAVPPPPPPPSATPQRVLRRSRDDRVAAGVSGGLGDYFGVDPVLFRVLFATAAFFGGAGILAYLVAWAAIPEQGAVNAPIDRFIAGLRRRRIPVWLVAAGAGLFLWAVAFSWWAPGRFFPLIAVVIVLVAVFGRRGSRRYRQDAAGFPPAYPAPYPSDTALVDAAPPVAGTTVSFEKPTTGMAEATGPSEASEATPPPVTDPNRPAWVGETRQWILEAKAASRERRRRSWPLRVGALVTLVATIAVLAIADAVSGVAIPVYFWAAFAIVGTSLLAGLVLRRTPWSLLVLLAPAVLGLVAFAPTSASFHDGSGDREWTPISAAGLKDHYHLAFGRIVLDLRDLGPLPAGDTVHIRLAAGQVHLELPPTLNATVNADVHTGSVREVSADGSRHESNGWGIDKTIQPGPRATGAPLTIDVDLADGQVLVDRTG